MNNNNSSSLTASSSKETLPVLEFVQPPSKSLFCPICQEIFQDPVIIRTCSHTFCHSCLIQSTEQTPHQPKCPLCRQKFSTNSTKDDIHSNLAVLQIIRDLLVRCPNSGCGFVETRETVLRHSTQSCHKRLVNCPNADLGCNFKATWDLAQSHMDAEGSDTFTGVKKCIFEDLKPFIIDQRKRISQLEEKIGRQVKEIARLREFVRTSKTNPSATNPILTSIDVSQLDSPAPSSSTPLQQHNSAVSTNDEQLQPTTWANSRHIICKNTIKEHTCGVTALCLDDRFIYSGAYDGSVKVFDIQKSINDFPGESAFIESQFTGHQNTIWAMTIASKSENGLGRRLFTGGSDKTIKCWDLSSTSTSETSNSRTISPMYDIAAHSGKIYSLLLADSQKMLFSSSSDRLVKLWNAENMCLIASLKGHTDNVNGLALTYDNRSVISGSSDKSVRLWDVETRECLQVFQCGDSEVLDVSCDSMESNLIFASTYDAAIHCFDKRQPLTAQPIARMLGHNWEVWQVEYCADNCLFSASFDHTIRKWDTRMFEQVDILLGHKGYVHAIKCGADMLASACADKTVKLWTGAP